jgi:hypothetical protein
MFRADTQHKRFQSIAYGGFDVLDFSVLDEALVQVEKKMEPQQKHGHSRNQLLIAEFARDDYQEAFKYFSARFLSNTHILFVDAPLDICIQRIRNRVTYGTTADDHFISEHILRNYYGRDNFPYMEQEAKQNDLLRRGGNDVGKVVQVISNTGTLFDFYAQVHKFTEACIRQEKVCQQKLANLRLAEQIFPHKYKARTFASVTKRRTGPLVAKSSDVK